MFLHNNENQRLIIHSSAEEKICVTKGKLFFFNVKMTIKYNLNSEKIAMQ